MNYAAHISEDKKREQSVKEHCQETARLCSMYCSDFGAENIGKVAGLLHDAGKLCRDFDYYIRGNSSKARGAIDHSYAGAKYIMEIAADENRGVARLIARVIISHHGLHDWIDDDCEDYFSKRISNDENYEEVKEAISSVVSIDEFKALLNLANSEYNNIKAKAQKLVNNLKDNSRKQRAYAFYLGMFERLIESALTDADRTDTAAFMDNVEIPEPDRDSFIWETMRTKMNEKLKAFEKKTDLISRQRRSISDRCAEFAGNEVHICRMIVPTGGGKTLSSLRFATEYCIKHKKKRILYTAPFMSILEQNSDEIRSLTGDELFTEHHSNALAEFECDNEKGEDDEAIEEYKNYELHTERLDNPVIATTMVQLLNSLFKGKMSSVRRFHRLAGSVLIIDEVQSLPLRCVMIFNLAMNFLAYICGATVVLCTATQPDTSELDYPMIIDENESMSGDYSKDFEVFRRNEIISKIDPYGMSYEDASRFCYAEFERAGNLLVIVNTKAAARNMYENLKELVSEGTELIHLSANMCPEHRRERINYIRKLLDTKNPKPVVCVTTQLIEAGVDISFKCVVRSVAGLDNAVQAAGRCNRHGENDGVCPVYLIKLRDESVEKMKDVLAAQKVTLGMQGSKQYDDFSSPSALTDYFRKLYCNEKNKLYYSADNNETIFSYLSVNGRNKLFTTENPNEKSRKYEFQAFKTAGMLFKAIDDNTQGVIVPYNDEAEDIIRKLEKNEGNISGLLRNAQKYTVNIFAYTGRKLHENKAVRVLENNVVILEKNNYSKEYGVITDYVEKELLLF
ncbi:MAG: CRISPR-associated helicase Cas3' [Oscillospiraceae bacterium]|nr:CRISPR-associated helicase Cas3' [Oscillospiraceae bacterium]